MTPDRDQVHRLEVRLDILRERVLFWRITAVSAAIVGLFLIRSMVL